MSTLFAAAVPLVIGLLMPRMLLARWPELSRGRLVVFAVLGALAFDVLWIVVIDSGIGRWLASLDNADPMGFAVTVWAGLLAAPVLALVRSLWIIWRRRA